MQQLDEQGVIRFCLSGDRGFSGLRWEPAIVGSNCLDWLLSVMQWGTLRYLLWAVVTREDSPEAAGRMCHYQYQSVNRASGLSSIKSVWQREQRWVPCLAMIHCLLLPRTQLNLSHFQVFIVHWTGTYLYYLGLKPHLFSFVPTCLSIQFFLRYFIVSLGEIAIRGYLKNRGYSRAHLQSTLVMKSPVWTGPL